MWKLADTWPARQAVTCRLLTSLLKQGSRLCLCTMSTLSAIAHRAAAEGATDWDALAAPQGRARTDESRAAHA